MSHNVHRTPNAYDLAFRVESEGRIHRLDFVARILFLWFLLIVLRGVLGYGIEEYGVAFSAQIWIVWAVLVLAYLWLRAQVLKRIRDIGHMTGVVHVFLWMYFALYAIVWLSLLLMSWDSAMAYELTSLMQTHWWTFSMMNIGFGVLMLCLCLIPGQKWDNAFGLDPKK